jgi:succinate--hydroxymethylglutarate CoA-transferase
VLTTYQYLLPINQSYQNTKFYQVNRNKKSIGISFKEEKGAALIRNLALHADVFVENYLPGTLKKYGLDFKTLSKENPKLIYASVTGYGQTGPYSNRAGYDVMVEAYGLCDDLQIDPANSL